MAQPTAPVLRKFAVPPFWIIVLFVAIPFFLITLGPSPPTMQKVEFIGGPNGTLIPSITDVTPPHPFARYAALSVIIGWCLWLYFVYRVHVIAGHAAVVSGLASPQRAALAHLVPLYNFYWIFAWPARLAKSLGDTAEKRLNAVGVSVALCIALAITYAGLLPPSGVLSHAIALAIGMFVGMYVVRRLKSSLGGTSGTAQKAA